MEKNSTDHYSYAISEVKLFWQLHKTRFSRAGPDNIEKPHFFMFNFLEAAPGNRGSPKGGFPTFAFLAPLLLQRDYS